MTEFEKRVNKQHLTCSSSFCLKMSLWTSMGTQTKWIHIKRKTFKVFPQLSLKQQGQHIV